MKKQEATVMENKGKVNAFGIEIDEPLQNESMAKTYEMKPMAFPTDARGYWLASG